MSPVFEWKLRNGFLIIKPKNWAIYKKPSSKPKCIIMLWQRGLTRDPFSPIRASLSDNFSNKTVRDEMFWLGMTPKEILSRLFNPLHSKILDLYLETWLRSPLICVKKALHEGSGYMGLCENIHFSQLCKFYHFLLLLFLFFTIIIMLLFLLVYISPLSLLSLLKLILLSFLPLLFIIIIY